MVDIINSDMLADICDVHVRTELPKRERMLDFCRQMNGNPKQFKHGKYIVVLSFSPEQPPLQEVLADAIRLKA